MFLYNILIPGLIVFIINYILSYGISLAFRPVERNSRTIIFLIWIPRIIILAANTVIFYLIFQYFHESSVKNIFFIGFTAYCVNWTRIIPITVIKMKKDDLRTILYWLPRQMFTSLVIYMAACFSAVYLFSSQPLSLPSLSVTIPDYTPIMIFILIVNHIAATAYIVGGIVFMVLSSRTKGMGAGFGVFMGLMFALAGFFMEGFLLLAPKPVAGIFMICCGIVLHILISNDEGFNRSAPPLITLIAALTILPGIGLLLTVFM